MEVQLSPEQCEEKVSEIVPTLSLVDLTNLCLELGLNIDDGIKGERLKVLKFVNKYLVNLEDEEAKAKYTQVYGYFKANQIKVEDEEIKNAPSDSESENEQEVKQSVEVSPEESVKAAESVAESNSGKLLIVFFWSFNCQPVVLYVPWDLPCQ